MGMLWEAYGPSQPSLEKSLAHSVLLTLVMFVSVHLHQAKRYFDPTTEPDGAE